MSDGLARELLFIKTWRLWRRTAAPPLILQKNALIKEETRWREGKQTLLLLPLFSSPLLTDQNSEELWERRCPLIGPEWRSEAVPGDLSSLGK